MAGLIDEFRNTRVSELAALIEIRGERGAQLAIARGRSTNGAYMPVNLRRPALLTAWNYLRLPTTIDPPS